MDSKLFWLADLCREDFLGIDCHQYSLITQFKKSLSLNSELNTKLATKKETKTIKS